MDVYFSHAIFSGRKQYSIGIPLYKEKENCTKISTELETHENLLPALY